MKQMEFLASYHQERMWFIDRFETGNVYPHPPVYHNIPIFIEMEGDVNVEWMRESFQRMVQRHEALRTSIIARGESLAQRIADSMDIEFRFVDPASMQYAAEFIAAPFNMSEGPLVRGALMRMENKTYLLVITLHHTIADRGSLAILATELLETYRALNKGESPVLPDLSLQYADFSHWQRTLPEQMMDAALLYWRRKLKGKIQALELPVDYSRAAIHVYQEKRYDFTIPGTTLEKLRGVGQGEDDFLLLLSVFKLLLHRYSANSEIVVGTTSDYRHHPGTADVVGPLANLLVLRSHLGEAFSFKGLLEQLKKTVSEAFKNQDLPFDKLVVELKPETDMSRTALFDVLFNLERNPMEFPPLEGAGACWLETNSGWGKYDINLLLLGDSDGYRGYLNYNSLLFKESTIAQFVGHFLVLIERAAAHPLEPLTLIPILTDDEKDRVLNVWNGTSSPYPDTLGLVDLFNKIARENGNKVALVTGDETLTYDHLDRRANRLALYLRQHNGVGSGDFVALSMEPSLDLLIGLLGILKSGAAYVPIDPSLPEQRIQFILEDSRCKARLMDNLPVEPSALRSCGGLEPETVRNPDAPAYVIYTSGTTGRPKGCVVSHRNVVRLFMCRDFPFDFGADDIWILAHAVSFDFSVWEIFGAFLFGGRLIVAPRQRIRATDQFLGMLEQYRVTVLNQTPRAFAALATMVKEDGRGSLARHLRYVVFGGDRLDPGQLKEWVGAVPLEAVRLINMYGITETTVHVTFYPLTEGDIFFGDASSPIGLALPETEVYILNRELRMQPVGVVGEIYVGGSGVAFGYLNRPQLTYDRFIENPYKPGETLYRSGDLGRRLSGGGVEYCGRMDGQVKIRGFRIETGEIHQQMVQYDGIKEALVHVGKNGDERFLVGYFIADGIVDSTDLRTFLLKDLPDYMVPSHFVQLEEFPLTENGKLDVDSLPAPNVELAEEILKPGNELEETLVGIWAEILLIEPETIGINSNFFNLGGHSLNATVLVSRIHKEFNVKIAISDVFRGPSIKELAEIIQSSSNDWLASIQPAEQRDFYELSSAQHRFFILNNMESDSLAYNMPFIQKIEGQIDLSRLEKAFEKVILRHESLRTAFLFIDGKAVQRIHSQVDFNVEYYKSDSSGAQSIIDSFVRPFDLATPPLLRLGFITIEAQSHILMLDMHHIICDGVSLNIFVGDLMAFYEGKELEPPKLQYKDFAQWQRQMLEYGVLKQKQEFWINWLAGELPVLNMSLDFPRPKIQDFSGENFIFVLDRYNTRRLNQMIADTGSTLYMVLLTFFTILLFKYSGQTDIIVGTPIAGRDHVDLMGIIGLLVETLITRNHPHPDKYFLQYLDEVKKNTLLAYENQGYPYGELLKLLVKDNDRSRNPLFDAMLVVQNFDMTSTNEVAAPGPLSVTPFGDGGSHVSKVDITLQATEMDNVIVFTLEYCTALFERRTMERFASAFQHMIGAVLDHSHVKISEIDIASELDAADTSAYKDEDSEFHF
jgi:amino acid adenylation domain-containing protein